MDPRLVDEVADFVADMIAFSEPITGSRCPCLEPNLVEVGYDNEDMVQAAAVEGVR